MSTISIYSQFAGEYLGKDKSFFCITQVFYGIHFRNIYNTFRRDASMYLNSPQLESDKISFKQSRNIASENSNLNTLGSFPVKGIWIQFYCCCQDTWLLDRNRNLVLSLFWGVMQLFCREQMASIPSASCEKKHLVSSLSFLLKYFLASRLNVTNKWY